jgi:hypothetical protein
MRKPREQRIRISLAVRVWGMDTAGRLFNVDAQTRDITPVGACIDGVFASLQRGAVIGVQCGRSQARFRVTWIGQRESTHRGQIGIRCIDPGKYIWGVPLPRKMEEVSVDSLPR